MDVTLQAAIDAAIEAARALLRAKGAPNPDPVTIALLTEELKRAEADVNRLAS